jgi:hypothetical protein
MKTSYQEKIIVLWGVFLFGILFHTQLGLMPLFHGQTIASNAINEPSQIALILWSMLAFFLLPMFAIVVTVFNSSKTFKTLHFGLTVFYSVINFLHVILDLQVRPISWYQITLMIVLFGIGLLLNLVAFRWMNQRPLLQRRSLAS